MDIALSDCINRNLLATTTPVLKPLSPIGLNFYTFSRNRFDTAVRYGFHLDVKHDDDTSGRAESH